MTRWLVVGPYPPERGTGPDAARAFVADRLATGDHVHVVSPRPTAAHEHAPLESFAGLRSLFAISRARRADALWLRVEPGVVLRNGIDRRRALAERAALAAFLRRFGTAVLDVGDVGLLPGGRAGRPVLAAASRFVVHRERDAEALAGDGVERARIERSRIDDDQAGAAVAPAVPSGSALQIDPSVYPPPTVVRDLPADRAQIEAAIRRRAEELRAARAAAAETVAGGPLAGG